MSAAAVGWRDGDAASGHRVRIALGAVAPTPVRVPAAEAVLAEGEFDEESRDAVRRAVDAAVDPITDVRATAEYRREAAATLAVRAVDAVLAKLSTGGAT